MSLALQLAGSRWPTVSLGYLVRARYGHPFSSESFTPSMTSVPIIRIRDVLPNKVQTWSNEEPPPSAWVDDGDLVIGMDGDFNHARWAGGRAALNQRVCALEPGPRLDPGYLSYVVGFPLQAINDTVHYTTVKHLSFNQLLGEEIPVPPLEVQRRIGGYLDTETARIDTLIARNEHAAALVEERWRSALNAAFDPAIASPGTPTPLRFVIRERDERVGRPHTHLPLLSVSVADGVRRRSTSNDGQVASDDLSMYKICRRGDIVINRMRAFQGGVGVTDEDGVVSSDYAVIRVAGEPRYFHHLMRSAWFVSEMTARLRGIGSPTAHQVRTPRINLKDLGEIVIGLPKTEVQEEVLTCLDNERARADAVVSALRRQRRLLLERRQSLITASVTGESEV